MITETILTIFMFIAEGIGGLLPDADAIGLTEFSGIWYGYGWLNSFLPLTELLQVISTYLTLYAALYLYLVVRAIRGWMPII